MNLYFKFCFIILIFLPFICCVKKKQLEIVTMSRPGECSKTAANGDTVAVHYTGKLENGQIFDSSIVTKRDPIKFQLGTGRVIPGWEKGILGMCLGEKRKLIIPPNLAYGDKGVEGVIPGDATLTFETELVALEKNSPLKSTNIGKLLNFAMWPTIILVVVVMLYKRITAAEEKIRSEKLLKKSRKKRH